jgi:serine/threonine-protein kinase
MTDLLDRLKTAVADRYSIQQELGRGGMAVVYLAQDQKLNRQVALKVLRPELAASIGSERFLREIEIAASLNHPNILALYDCGEADGQLYYTMPFVEGETLRDRLDREKQLSIEDALEVTREVGDALGHAHSLGIVHRDIKPENILFTAGHAVVSDFGIARAVTEAGGEKLTDTGIAIGTPVYMSPEQATGVTEVDARSDVYSLGCVLYEMLVGDPPFTGSAAQVILARKSLEAPPPLRHVRDTVSVATEDVVIKALAKMPADRFRTSQEFTDALDRAEGSGAAGRTRGISFWPRRAVHRVLAVGGAILALGAAAVLAPRVANTGLFQGAAATEPLRSIAVLPFVNQTGDSENDYLSDGITEELIGRLALFSGLERVISRASVYTYKGQDVDPRAVAQDLDVGVVVTGAIARRNEDWSLSFEVIDARDNRHLGGDTYDLTLEQLLDVADTLSREIPQAMNLEVTEEGRGASGERTSRDPEAHRLYLMGLHLTNQYTDNSLTQAIEYFEQALDRDPSYALPYSGLALLYSLMALFGLEEPTTLYPTAMRAAQRALILDDQLADAHMVMGLVHFQFEWDWEAAEREYQRALELNPRSSVVLTESAAFLLAMNRLDEAIELIRRALDLDPVSPSVHHAVGWAYYVCGEYGRAVEELRRALELFPTYGPIHSTLAWSLSMLDRGPEAVAAAEQAELLSSRGPWILASLGHVYAVSGREDRAQEMLEELSALARERYVDPHYVAVLYSGLGDTERALHWLERAHEARSPNLTFGCTGSNWFPGLIDDVRYQELWSRMNFPAD